MHGNVNLKRSGSNARSRGRFYTFGKCGGKVGLVEKMEKVGKIDSWKAHRTWISMTREKVTLSVVGMD